MAYLSDYTAGTVTVSGTTVTGSGTAWQTAQFREGDWFLDGGGTAAIVASIDSNTQATLAAPWEGPAMTDAPYRMRYMSDGSRASAQARQLIDMLGSSGNLEAIAGVTSAADTVPYFTGPGTASVTALTATGREIIGAADSAAARAAIGAIGNIVPEMRLDGPTPRLVFVKDGVTNADIVVVNDRELQIRVFAPNQGQVNVLTARYDDGSLTWMGNSLLTSASTISAAQSQNRPDTFGGRGSYVIAHPGTGFPAAIGVTVPGADLTNSTTGLGLSGSWRCVGLVTNAADTNAANYYRLWQRFI